MPVTVCYEGRRARVPSEPSTPLVAIRAGACAALGLDPLGFALMHGRKTLDLCTPFRFSNLVANASLDLVPYRGDVQMEPVRVKIRAPGNDFLGTFRGSDRVKAAADAAGIDTSKTTVCLYDMPVDVESSFAALGAKGSIAFTVSRGPRPAPQPAPSVNVSSSGTPSHSEAAPTQTTTGTRPVEGSGSSAAGGAGGGSAGAGSGQASPVAPKPDKFIGRNPQVHLSGIPFLHSAREDPPDITETQFRNYYTHLHNQATPRQMVSRSTRERLANEKKASIRKVTIRVRLPDQSFLEGSFSPQETGAHVYDFVRQNLRDHQAPFVLESPSPSHVLQAHDNLLYDCDFGTRALLNFKWTDKRKVSGPVLNDKALALAPSAPQDQKSTGEQGEPASTKPVDAEPSKSKGLSRPKWLKLGK